MKATKYPLLGWVADPKTLEQEFVSPPFRSHDCALTVLLSLALQLLNSTNTSDCLSLLHKASHIFSTRFSSHLLNELEEGHVMAIAEDGVDHGLFLLTGEGQALA